MKLENRKQKTENRNPSGISDLRPPTSDLQGFTLVEAMIAVTILTFAVAGPLFSASRAIVATQTARDQLTASYLAQEGIEYVRAMRDNEYLATLSTVGWDNFITGVESSASCLSPSLCTLDPVVRDMGYGSVFSLAPYSGDAPLYRRADGVYTQQSDGNDRTVFTRTIQVFHSSATDERIISKVSWSSHGTLYSVTITDHLTPWQ